jgi:putative transcriptional regulator
MARGIATRAVVLPLAIAGTVAAAMALQTATLAAPRSRAALVRPLGRPSQQGHEADDGLSVGKLLVASRTLTDRNFFQTVVLLIAYGEDGAAGFILNRQSNRTVGELLPIPDFRDGANGLAFLGGPVERSAARGLLHSESERRDLYRVLDGVYLLHDSDELTRGLAGETRGDHLRVYVGYAGWGAGQLEREVALGQWHVFEATTAAIFDPKPETLWQRQIRRTETLMAGAGVPRSGRRG